MSEAESKAWKCTICGYIHNGFEPPDFCPICGATKDLFESHTEPSPKKKPSSPAQWRCLNCGYTHDGSEPPERCPVCAAAAERFESYSAEESVSRHAELKEKVVIVGAGIAGVSAAEAIRKLSTQTEIVLLSNESHLPYYRLNLTRYLAGEVSADELELHPKNWYEERNVELQLNAELLTIDLEKKKMRMRDARQHSYDKLIFAVGSHPFVPSFPGVNKRNVTVLRTRDHADDILYICKKGMKCVCIGGGILGLETAGALAKRGADVTLLEGHGWLLPRQLNQRAGALLEKYVASTGISLRKRVWTEELVGDEHVQGVLLKVGSTIPADLVIITTGVRSNSYLGRIAGLEVNRGIVVDNTLKTSHPDIFAAGDVAEHRGVLYGIWGPSQYQGTIAGMNAAGERTEFAGIPRSNMLKVLGYDLFSIGQILIEDASYQAVEDELDGNYFYFLFRDHYMVGSILLGNTALSPVVKKVVEKRIDCSAFLQRKTAIENMIDFLNNMESR